MLLTPNRNKSLNFAHPDAIPVSAFVLPAAWMKYREALDEIVCRHPLLFGDCRVGKRDYDAIHTDTYIIGEHVDAWGCVWRNVQQGMEAIVTAHPVPTRAAVRTLKMPEQDSGFPHGFMYLRLLDLRGFEEGMIDFAEEPPELQRLIDVVLQYNLRQAQLRLDDLHARGGTGSNTIVAFGDDLGLQHRLPIHPRKWRHYLKPCFARIYAPFREAGYYVYMHTDGHILPIIPDLVACGVTVVNPQVRANGIAGLVDVCKGHVCLDVDLDRQLFPFCSPQDVADHVHEVVDKLGSPAGGLWLKAEIGMDIPLENIEALFSALETYRLYFSI